MKTKFYSLSMALVALWLFSSIQLSAQTPTVTVLQPSDPNIEWTAGGTYVISWIDNFQSTVDVILINGDSVGTPHYLTTLASNITSSTYYWNTAGYPLGTHYKIRVQNHQSPTVYKDESNHYFTLSDQAGGFITLEQPVGNETWAEGNTYVISWNDNLTAPVRVELLKNNAPYDTLVASTTGSTLNWTVPTSLANNSKIYKIRVSSTVTGATTTPATSGSFKISASAGTFVEVLQPNGGEKWARGTTHVISWNDDIPEPVNVELYNGSTWVHNIATDVVGSTYYWTIDPNEATGDYVIYVKSTSDSTHLNDRSNNSFHITASGGTYVEVYQPNGGEHWARGTSHLISWNDDMTEPVNVELYNGSTWVHNIATDVVGSTYVWAINDTLATGDYVIYVKSTLDSTLLNDRSNSSFHITASAGTTVTVIQPNGSESWAQNTTHLISWIDDIPEPVNVELWNTSGKVRDIATGVVGSTCYWTIDHPLETPGHYRVYVRSTLDSNLYDRSNGYFSITGSTGTYVTVLQPNGGENWIAGHSYLVSWNDDFTEGVNIVLCSGYTPVDTIGLDVLGSTTVWDIPVSTTPGTNYRVEVYSTLDSTSLHDFSDAYFHILAPTLLTPYPNPANNNVTINMANMGESSSYTVQVYDRFNNEVGEYNTNSNSINLSTANFVNGIYFVVVTSDNNRATTKIIVQH